MSSFLPPSIQKVIDEFSKLPGIGPKSAERLAMHLLYSPHRRVNELGSAVSGLKEGVQFCDVCWNVAEQTPCKLCDDEKREQGLMCIVEGVLDVVALEKTLEYKGVYHVLHGLLSPVDGIGPEQLKMAELYERLEKMQNDEHNAVAVKEIVIATNPSLEGEATALYIQKMLSPLELNITRLARGLPAGASLEYADSVTLSRALQGRQGF